MKLSDTNRCGRSGWFAAFSILIGCVATPATVANSVGETYRVRLAVTSPLSLSKVPMDSLIDFTAAGNGCALNRCNTSGALLGKSSGDLTSWKWYDLGSSFSDFGGPNLIETPYGWVGGGRMHDNGHNTSLTHIDVENPSMYRILKLPSSGSCGYPGFVWHNDLLYVSYYSSHEGKTSIYRAKVRLSLTSTTN